MNTEYQKVCEFVGGPLDGEQYVCLPHVKEYRMPSWGRSTVLTHPITGGQTKVFAKLLYKRINDQKFEFAGYV